MDKRKSDRSDLEQLRQELITAAHTRDALRESLGEFKEIQQLSETIRSAVEPDYVVEALFGVVARLVDFDSCAVYLMTESDKPVCFGSPEKALTSAVPGMISDGIIDWIQGEQRAILVPDIDVIQEESDDSGQQLSFLVVPLAVGGQGIGFFICTTSAVRDTITQHSLDTIFYTVNQAAVALQNSLLYQKIERTSAFLDTLITQAQEAVILLDEEGSIQFANPAIVRMGWSKDKFLHRDFIDLLIERKQQKQLQQLLASRKTGRLEATLINDQQQKLETDITVTPLQVEMQNRSMLLVRDMTETRQLQEKARFAEKFQLLSEAAIAVSHEINNPLTTIKSQLYLMLNDKDSPMRQKDRERLQTLMENSDRIADVIQRFEQLESLESVNYLGDLKMLNLRPDRNETGEQDKPPEDQN